MVSSTDADSNVASGHQPRIPLALQQVFLQSQRGENVEKIAAPRGNIGFRMFKRAWNGFRNRDGNTNPSKPIRGSLKTSSQGKVLMKAPSTSSLTSLGSRKSMDSDSVVTSASKRPTAADASRAAIAEKRKSGGHGSSSKPVSFFPVAVPPAIPS